MFIIKSKFFLQKGTPMKKLLFFTLFLLSISISQSSYSLLNPLKAGSSLVSNFSSLASTLSSDPNIISQMQDAINSTIALKALASCKGKPKGSQVKTKDGKVILTCGNLRPALDAARKFLAVFRDKLIGTTQKPGILMAALNVVDALDIKSLKTGSIISQIDSINGSLHSLDELLAKLPETIQVKKIESK